MTEGLTMRERMPAGELYIAADPDLARDAERARRLSHRLDTMDPDDGPGRRAVPTELLGRLGEDSHIRPGVTIGADTVVGAGAVVVRDLPPDVVAVGNPARVVRPVEP